MQNLKKKIRKKYKSIKFRIRVIYLTRINTLLLLRNLYTIQHIFSLKKVVAALSIMTVAGSWLPIYNFAKAGDNKIVYPIQEMSEIECRFQKFSELSSACKRKLPILKTKDYKKYVKQAGWYNDYTRIYTVLWGSSYKYGWDVWNGGHLGTDIASAEGTPVYSIAEWKVIIAKYMPGWGNNISIEHIVDGKKIVSNYSHLSKIGTSVGKKIKAGAKIGEVGNTWNSFGNHLHFQIDLDTPFHPYYYDYKKCPYSFSKISESDICFDELAKNTIDPLAFLESKGAILDKVDYSSSESKIPLWNKKTSLSETSNTKFPDVLYTYVHVDSETSDIRDLQTAFKDMGIYKWSKTGKYSDIKQVLVAYQIDRGVIENKDSVGAGYFGPKTRAQAQADYREYLAGKKFENPIEFKTSKLWDDSSDSKIKNNIKVEKISRTEVLTREEIEKREVDEFRNAYQIDLRFDGSMGNVGLGKTETIKFIINNSKGRPYKWRTPSDITIETDENILKVFPNKMYQFTDGERDIQVTGLKKWVTELKIKMWDTVLKKFKVNVFNGEINIVPKNWSVLSAKKIVLWEEKTGFVVMKDENNTRLLNLKYEGDFRLSSDTDTKFCLKRTSLSDIKDSLKIKCSAADYKDSIKFNYSHTAWGILVFDYKVGQSEANILVHEEKTNKRIGSKQLLVTGPKWLGAEYAYSGEVQDLLEKGIVDGISRGYFLEDRELSRNDAVKWLENTLIILKDQANSDGKRAQIQEKLNALKKQDADKYSYLSRRAFLEKATDFLVFDDVIPEMSIEYRDLNEDENKKANLVFDSDNTWRDRFGEKYYRPKEKISRGEAAYLISRVLEKKTSSFVTLK